MARRPTTGQAGSSRFSIRLRPDDQILLRERAAARGMPAATYVSVLTRAHLRSLSPLPKEELLALRRTVSELGSIGRNLNQIARAANRGERASGPESRGLEGDLEGLRRASRSRQGTVVGQHQVVGARVCRARRIANPCSICSVTPAAVPVGATICRRGNSAGRSDGSPCTGSHGEGPEPGWSGSEGGRPSHRLSA